MAQKCSDRETIPMCRAHHQEQHRIGLRRFTADYQLDLFKLIQHLNERPRVLVIAGRFVGLYRGQMFKLFVTSQPIAESIELAKMLCREYLIEQMFQPASKM
jgi:Putative HNHc nuclease